MKLAQVQAVINDVANKYAWAADAESHRVLYQSIDEPSTMGDAGFRAVLPLGHDMLYVVAVTHGDTTFFHYWTSVMRGGKEITPRYRFSSNVIIARPGAKKADVISAILRALDKQVIRTGVARVGGQQVVTGPRLRDFREDAELELE